MSAMEAGYTLLSVDGTAATRKPARAHPASRTKLAACGRDSGWVGPRLSSDKVQSKRFWYVCVCVLRGDGRSGYCKWTGSRRGGTCSPVQMHLQFIPSFRW